MDKDNHPLDWRDRLVIVCSIIASIVILLVENTIFSLSCIFLTHLFIIPSLIIIYKSKSMWLFYFVVFSIVASLLWHFSREWFYEEELLKLDIIHQNLLIAISISLIVFKHVPRFMIGILFTYTIILAVFCLNKLWGFDVYLYLSAIWILVLIAHIILELVRPSEEETNWWYLIIMFIYTTTAVSLYELASGDNYNSVHSVWHILAYTSLYFSFKMSFKTYDEDDEELIVLPRVDFEIEGKIQEIRKLLF